MKKIHWVILVVLLVIGGSWFFNSGSDLITCPKCSCENVTCCADGSCGDADCDCSCEKCCTGALE